MNITMSSSKGKDEEDLKWEQQCLLLNDVEMRRGQKVILYAITCF